MLKKRSKTRELETGDLVMHLLYGRTWVGVLIDIVEETNGLASPREVGLVQMQPNSEYESFFRTKVSKKYRINDTMGYVSMNWLFKLEKTRERSKD